MYRTNFDQKNILNRCFGHCYVPSINITNEFKENSLRNMMELIVSFDVFLMGICVIYGGE